MSNDDSILLNEIGDLLLADQEYPTQPALLYAEVGDNWTGQSIFKELGNQVLYRRPIQDRMTYALLELWESWSVAERWAEMEYVLRDGKFDVRYIYADMINPAEDLLERRARAVQRHFGDKPIVYPPWSSEDDLSDYEL